jgi:hypothetical protein
VFFEERSEEVELAQRMLVHSRCERERCKVTSPREASEGWIVLIATLATSLPPLTLPRLTLAYAPAA